MNNTNKDSLPGTAPNYTYTLVNPVSLTFTDERAKRDRSNTVARKTARKTGHAENGSECIGFIASSRSDDRGGA